MNPIFQRDSIRIVATDSGLGGMAVVSDLAMRLAASRAFRKAKIVFFNCRPSDALGYDMMTNHERRTRVFSNALEAMAREFTPDAILVACNTLSVLQEQTAFSRVADRPQIVGIVELGVSVIARHLAERPKDTVIMYAAPTTVQSGVHKQRLMALGCPAGRLVYQDCAGLPTAIEQGLGDGAAAMIDDYVARSVAGFNGHRSSLVSALLCTHFGFALDLFEAAFRKHGIPTDPILDPTPHMAASFLDGAPAGRYDSTDVDIEVVSHTRLTKESVECIAGIMDRISPLAACALRDYELRPDLFDIK